MREQVMNEEFIENQLKREHLKKKHAELRMKMKNYDEVLAKMINEKTRDAILNTIKDFLSQHES